MTEQQTDDWWTGLTWNNGGMMMMDYWANHWRMMGRWNLLVCPPLVFTIYTSPTKKKITGYKMKINKAQNTNYIRCRNVLCCAPSHSFVAKCTYNPEGGEGICESGTSGLTSCLSVQDETILTFTEVMGAALALQWCCISLLLWKHEIFIFTNREKP